MNDRTLSGRDATWVDELRDYLTACLDPLARRKNVVKIWHDSALRVNERFGPEIAGAIQGSAVFLALLSRAYSDPESYCLKELAAFEAEAARYPVARAFALLIDDLKPAELPPLFQGTSPLPFFRRLDRRGATQPLDPPGWAVDATEFRDKLGILANDIWQTLQGLAEAGIPLPNNRPPVPGLAAGDMRPQLFLSDVTDDLDEDRTTLAKAFGDYAVLPAARLPADEAAIREAIEQSVPASLLSVVLLGPLPGRKPDGSPRGIAQIQTEEVLRLTRQKPLIWVAPEVDPAQIRDQTYREFITALLGSQRSSVSFELLRKDLVELKEVVAARLVASRAPERPAPAGASSTEPTVYVSFRDAGGISVSHIDRLSRDLEHRHCTVTVLNHAEASRVERLHPKFLRLSDAMVIAFDAATREWAEELALDADAFARSQQNRLRRLGLLPAQSGDFSVRSSRINELHLAGDGSIAGLDDFVRGLAA